MNETSPNSKNETEIKGKFTEMKERVKNLKS